MQELANDLDPGDDGMATMTLEVGASKMSIDPRGLAVPDGESHLVDTSWHAACGAGRMRFVFPSMRPADATMCRACKTAAKRGAA